MSSQPASDHHSTAHRRYRFYDFFMVGFVVVLVASNLIGPAKSCKVGPIIFGAGNIFFPIGYIFGDVLTEVYGYARARRVIWAGFAAMAFVTFMGWVVIHLPLNPSEPFNKVYQPALEVVFGGTWRIALASMLAYWVGDFLNSFVLAKMKLLTNGRYLWTRTIGSTVVGQFADSILFYPLAFAGIWESSTLFAAVLFNFGFKVAVEVLWTPITYLVVNALKRAEHEDYYDTDTNFTPFTLQEQ